MAPPTRLLGALRLLQSHRIPAQKITDGCGTCQGLLFAEEWERADLAFNFFPQMCSSSEAGSYLMRIDFCITQLEAWE